MADLETGTKIGGFEATHLGNLNAQLELTSAYSTHADDTIKHSSTAEKNKWNAAEANAIEFAKSYGLGTSAKNISGTNLNNINETGFYMGNSMTNTPGWVGAQWMFILNFKHNDNYRKQIVFPFTTYTTSVFQRNQNNGTWSSWGQLLESSMINQPDGVLGLDETGKIRVAQLTSRIATGTYVGNGGTSTIVTGFQPSYVRIIGSNSASVGTYMEQFDNAYHTQGSSNYNGSGVSGAGFTGQGTRTIYFDSTGFRAATDAITLISPNNNGWNYSYIAMRM